MDALTDLDARLQELAGTRDYSGIARITGPDGVLFEGCYGLADRAAGVPVTPATRFGLASFTKMFTAVALLDQVRAGRAAVHSRVVDLLPSERRPATLDPAVTLHHLLTHTSGIADYAEEEGDEAVDYAELWADRPVQRFCRPADFLPLFGDLPPYRPPGGPWRYCNAGYVLLGLVIEELAGAPYTDVVVERVFGPAGMADSGFFRLDEVHPHLAVGHLRPSGPGGVWRTNVYSVPVVGGADGGAQCTAADLDRFLRRLDDGTLLGRELTAQLLTPHVQILPGWDMGYGVLLQPDRWGHGGGDPGLEMKAYRMPGPDATVVALCNVEGVVDEVRDLLVDAVRVVL
ncbi:MAG TPA: serine hydrolase domain-containing protein [Mycobacteriales bacterium]|nr:serine hydrolase domain-containing protein [Mycobacteriales bacterium]